MALRRIPLSDLLSVTVRQPLLDQVPPPGHCFISFRAGLMPRVDGKLTSDKRKGQLAVVKNEDGLIALQWFEREAKEDGSLKLAEEPELDQIVFEFDGQFDWAKREKRLLKMSFKEDPARNLFFWLQEPDTMWDDDLVMRLNKAIVGNHWKPAAAAPMAAPASTANPTTPAAAQAPAPAQASTSTGAGNLLNFDALLARKACRSMKAGAQRGQYQATGPSLADVLSKDFLCEALKQPHCFEALKEHLPSEHQTPAELSSLPRTAQFEQQLQGLSIALSTDRIDTSQFGIEAGPGVLAFLEAIQELVDKEKQKSGGAADMDS